MKVSSKSFPHPVLGNDDDVGGRFTVDFRYELSRRHVALMPTFILKNPNIESLVRKGKASFVCEVECRSTFFRRSYSTRDLSERFSIDSKFLRERVTAGFYVCAAQDIKNYSPSEPHEDYAEAVFSVEAGDILAVAGFCSFIAEKQFDPLRPPVSSFMSIMEGPQHEGPMQVDYQNEKITIILSKSDWKNYVGVRGQKLAEGILHASIVFPVLVDAVHLVLNENSDFSEMNWYGRIESIIDAKGLRDREPFESAQKILENPAARSFIGINSLLDETSD